jgi:glycosyltransferase involved in cell wall biosynthesis
LIGYRVNNGKTAPLVKRMSDHGIPVHEFYGNGPYSIKFLRQVKKVIKEGKYDLVQSNLIHANVCMAIIKFFFARKMKLISVKHGFNEVFAAKYGFAPRKTNRSLYTWVERFAGYMINYNVTISKGVYDFYVKGKITRPSKIKLVYYGIDLGHIPRDGYVNKSTERYAIILGRLVKYKGHELVIRAWAKVKEYNPSLRLYIVGDGPYQPQLEKLVKELGLTEQVKFLGHQPNPHELLHFAEFSLVSSLFEGFGLITLESWYHKKPVISFDVPAFNEVIKDGQSGFIVPAFDTSIYGDRIIGLFNDPGKAREMGELAYATLMKDYTVERMANQMIEVYKSI